MKKRIDVLLYEKGLAKSREKAKTQIIAGCVYINGAMVKSPSDTFDENVEIDMRKDDCPYVSRGGLKLAKAIGEFEILLDDKVCADIGASTGGFTDCMLKNGASFVYAIDVGYGQFDWVLRNDPRICLMERTNARYLEFFERKVDFVSVDVSFISLALIFPAIMRICRGDAVVITLIKPQFEAGKDKVGKKGVVREPETHIEVIKNVITAAEANGLFLCALSYSPIKGPNGNIEYLAQFASDGRKVSNLTIIEDIVHSAHHNL